MLQRRAFITIIGCALVGWPLTTLAQRPIPVIGFLSSRAPSEAAEVAAAFRQGLAEKGFVVGQNLTIEYRWAEGHYDQLPKLAADLVNQKVDLIAATGGPPPTLAAKAATSTIPIVFVSGDPVGEGLVASLSHPGGNATGFGIFAVELTSKRIELLSELVPGVRDIGLLVNPKNQPQTAGIIRAAQEAAQVRGLKLHVLNASSESEIAGSFIELVRLRVGALVVGVDPFFDSQREQFVTLATRNSIPAIYWLRDTAVSGGLISYGPSLTAAYKKAGSYAAEILKGSKPGDLPVQQPTKFDLVINLKAAKALGLAIPEELLLRADEVIE